MIEKKLIQIGNSWGILLPKPVIEALRIKPLNDKVEIFIENDEIRIKKIKKR